MILTSDKEADWVTDQSNRRRAGRWLAASVRKHPWIWATGALVIVLGVGWVWMQWADTLGIAAGFHWVARGMTRVVHRLGIWGPVLLVVALALHSVAFFFPMEIPTVVAFGVYGTGEGLAIVWTGSMLAAYVSYALGRVIGPPLLSRFHRYPKVLTVAGEIGTLGPAALILLRWVSFVPFDVLNMVFGSCGVPLKRFSWTTGIGVLATNLVMGLVVRSAQHLNWEELFGVVAVVVLLGWYAWRRGTQMFPQFAVKKREIRDRR